MKALWTAHCSIYYHINDSILCKSNKNPVWLSRHSPFSSVLTALSHQLLNKSRAANANVSRCLPCTCNPPTLENNLAVFLKKLNIPTIWFSHSSPIYLPRRPGSLCSHKELRTDVHSSLIWNSPKLEATRMSSHREMDKQTVVCPYNGIQLHNQKE